MGTRPVLAVRGNVLDVTLCKVRDCFDWEGQVPLEHGHMVNRTTREAVVGRKRWQHQFEPCNLWRRSLPSAEQPLARSHMLHASRAFTGPTQAHASTRPRFGAQSRPTPSLRHPGRSSGSTRAGLSSCCKSSCGKTTTWPRCCSRVGQACADSTAPPLSHGKRAKTRPTYSAASRLGARLWTLGISRSVPARLRRSSGGTPVGAGGLRLRSQLPTSAKCGTL